MIELLTRYYGLDWLAMVLMFLSLVLLGRKKRSGFLFGIGANLAWLAFGAVVGSVANVVANLVFAVMNVLGYIRWANDDNENADGPSGDADLPAPDGAPRSG